MRWKSTYGKHNVKQPATVKGIGTYLNRVGAHGWVSSNRAREIGLRVRNGCNGRIKLQCKSDDRRERSFYSVASGLSDAPIECKQSMQVLRGFEVQRSTNISSCSIDISEQLQWLSAGALGEY